jgi:hypothetical protein
MLKKLVIGTALSALALSGAFAQSNPSTDPPANSQQLQSGSQGGSSTKPSPTTGASPSVTTTAPVTTMGSAPSGNRPGTTDDSLKAGTEDKPASSGR